MLSKRQIASFCAQLATLLHAGLPIRRALDTMGKMGGKRRVKEVARKLGSAIEGGATLTEAMEQCDGLFPRTALHIVNVGEKSGALDETLKSLGEYYDLTADIQRRVLARLIYPAIQVIITIGVLGLAKHGAAWISGDQAAGARILFYWFKGYGAIAGVVALFMLANRFFTGRRVLHEAARYTPVVNWIMQTRATTRFSWAMELMYNAGMPIGEALKRSMEATGNGAFEARAPQLVNTVIQGGTVADGLKATKLFPVEFVEIIRVGEESGSLGQTLERQRKQLMEKSEQAMHALGVALNWAVWAIVAGVLVYLIISMWLQYVQNLQSLTVF